MRLRTGPPREPPLSDILTLLLPTEEETWLLRACLHEGPAGRSAWREWTQRVANPKEALAEDKHGGQVLPLLYRVLGGSDSMVDRGLLPYLRTAAFREELRADIVRRVSGDALTALTAASIPYVVLGDVALAETVYGDWSLRHCHDLSVLVHQGDQVAARAVLQQAGFAPVISTIGGSNPVVELEHASGFPVRFQTDLLSIPYYHPPLNEMWERSVEAEIASAPARLLAPEDGLLYACGQAACSSSRNLLHWVCDSWYTMQRSTGLDWDSLLESAIQARLALPLAVMFGYLAHELGAGVPSHFLDGLAVAAAKTDVVGVEAALSGVRQGSRGSLGNIHRHAVTPRSRAAFYKWALLPAPATMRWTYPGSPPWQLPWLYIRRPLGGLLRLAWIALRGRPQMLVEG